MTRYCGKCGGEHERRHSYCEDCHAAYMREWRKTHPLNEAHANRDIARSYAFVNKKRGKLAPRPCCICGDTNAEMHHPHHERPLEVVWLCREHHLNWHSFWREAITEIFAAWMAVNVDREGTPVAPASAVADLCDDLAVAA